MYFYYERRLLIKVILVCLFELFLKTIKNSSKRQNGSPSVLKKNEIIVIMKIEKVFYKEGFMKVTIQDVAKEAGVSITTVSRVINKNYPVKEETKKKVEEAIQKLNFTPNPLARGLIINQTLTVGVLVPGIANLFFPAVIKGIEKHLKKKGFTLFLCDTEGNPQEEKKMVKTLLDRRVDGLIVMDPRKENIDNGFFEGVAKEHPLILINGEHKGVRCNFILSDQEMGTYEALRYLIQLGHKKIAFLRGGNSYSYDLKEEVYLEVMKQSHKTVEEDSILLIQEGNSMESVNMSRQVVYERLQRPDPPTALFACNDWMALGAIQGAKEAGQKVPQDLSIIGFDNTLMAELSSPRLTTIEQNMYELGKTAAHRLLTIMKQEQEDVVYQKITIPTQLIIRESTNQYRKKG